MISGAKRRTGKSRKERNDVDVSAGASSDPREETARIARTVSPNGTVAMRLRDVSEEVSYDEQLAALYPVNGTPASAPWRLAQARVLQ